MTESVSCYKRKKAEDGDWMTKEYRFKGVNPEGKLDQLCDIHGICSARGLIVMAETAEELSGVPLHKQQFEKLQKEAGGEWYGAYLQVSAPHQ